MARQTQLCRYAYDPLDRLASRTPLAAAIAQDFYRNDKLATQVQGSEQRSFLLHDSQLLAQHTLVGKLATTTLIATDSQHSVLHADSTPIGYAPYGHRPTNAILPGLPGFNGEQPDPVTGHYLLGNGYRAYNPTLMRFNSPDSESPFGKGGVNAYAYCAGNPVSRRDPDGHEFLDILLPAVYLGLGLATALLGVRSAYPAVRAVFRSVKVSSRFGVGKGLPANFTEKLKAGVGVGAMAASMTWTSAFIVRTIEPDSPAERVLSVVAIYLASLTFGMRYRLSTRENSIKAAYDNKVMSFFQSRPETSRPLQSLFRRGRYQDPLRRRGSFAEHRPNAREIRTPSDRSSPTEPRGLG